MMLQQVVKDVMLRINDVALRANGIVTVRLDCWFIVDFQPKVRYNQILKGDVAMKEDKLGNLSMELSVEVLKLTKELLDHKILACSVYSNRKTKC